MPKVKLEITEANRAYWERRAETALHFHGELCKRPDDMDYLKSLSTEFLAKYSLCLHVTGHISEGQQMAAAGVRLAEELHRTRQFPLFLKGEAAEKSPYKELNEAGGLRANYEGWHYCDWFQTGEKRLDLLAKSNFYYLTRQNINGWRFSDAVADLMLRYVDAEQYSEALSLFREKFPDSQERLSDAKFSAGAPATCALLAEYCLGKKELEPFARHAVETWFRRSTTWSNIRIELPWINRLAWGNVWCRHFLGITELQPMLELLRRY